MKFLARKDMGILKHHQLRLIKDDALGHSDDSLVLEEAKPKIKPPPLYQVVMFNDDYTPMEFVVHVLESFFAMDREKATRVMLKVHQEGKAVCGVFTRDIAETKAAQVNEYSKQNEHPLLCEIEEVEDD